MQYKPSGVCARAIDFDIEGDTVVNVSFTGGCNGNLKGIGTLVEGMKIDDVIKKLEGTTCGFKPTSCPDQLAKALKEATSAV
ncbi:MAG: TIGR03905 family TSCPD domain-containing protein [Eubacteriales bacterium]